MVAEEQLAGGVMNAGVVVRDGAHVLRPSSPHSSTIFGFLQAVRSAGFDGVPQPAGFTDDGRERLVYIPGEVALPPFPDWAQTDEALVSAAALMRRFHDASARIEIVCHNDVCWENVVFRDGVAIALLDFDFAAPGRPLYDLAQFVRMCVPIDDDDSAQAMGWSPVDRPRRFRLVADAYGLDASARTELLEIVALTVRRGGEWIKSKVDEGHPAFVAMWNEIGGMVRFDRRRRWFQTHLNEFIAATK
jgi:hypothetical protein